MRNLVLVPFYLRYLSSAEYGAWVATGQVLAYLVTDFGVLAVLLQQLAVAYGQGNRARLERLGGTGLITSIVIGAVCTIFCLTASPIIPLFLHAPCRRGPRPDPDAGHRLHRQRGLYTGSCLCRVSQEPAAALPLRADARAGRAGRRHPDCCPSDPRMGIALAGLGASAADRAGRQHQYVLAPVALACEFRFRLRWATADAWSVGKLSVYQGLTYLAGGLKESLDPFLIGVILSPEIALAYTLTTRSSDMIRLQLVGPLSAAMIPSLAHLHGEGRHDHFKRIVITMSKVQTLIASIGLGGVLIYNRSFVTLWVGKEHYAGAAVTALITVYALLYLTAILAYEVLYSMGQFWDLAEDGLARPGRTRAHPRGVGLFLRPLGRRRRRRHRAGRLVQRAAHDDRGEKGRVQPGGAARRCGRTRSSWCWRQRP